MTSPHGIRSAAYRPTVLGTRGMICSGHHLASLAGARVLLAGGNAVDAALAVASTLGLVEPHMSGPGGDGYLMVHWEEKHEVRCVNGTGPAPSGATRALFEKDGIPYKGIRSVSVPGLVGGWMLAHAEYGRRPLSEVFAPACQVAEDGFPVSAKLAAALRLEAEADSPLFSHGPSRAIFAPGGGPLETGDILRNPDYADMLRDIAREGAIAFYRGRVARGILALNREAGGLFEEKDLARYRSVWQDPIRTTYRGHEVLEYPPGSSGHVLLQELNLVEQFPMAEMGLQSPESIHVMVEAKKLAFADRERYLGDPDFVRVPLGRLLSKEYAAERAASIHAERAAADVRPGAAESPEDTTCFCVVDRWGNAVCQLQSIQSGFGSGLVVEGTGVLLNNRMTYWHLEPGHPDELVPGKRVRHTMNPFMVRKNNRLMLLGGTPGADTQVQTNLQLISHVLDFGLTVQEAVEAPRWRHTGNGTESEYPHRCEDELILEDRFPAETRAGLAKKGHSLRIIGDWEAAGSAQLIQITPATGVLAGGSDPRRDGAAIAL